MTNAKMHDSSLTETNGRLSEDIPAPAAAGPHLQTPGLMSDMLGAQRAWLLPLLDSISDSLALLRPEPQGLYRIVAVNQTIARNTGFAADLLINRTVDQVLPEPHVHFLREQYETVIRTGAPVSYEKTSEFPIGTRTFKTKLIPVSIIPGQDVYILAVSQDVTSRREAEHALQRAYGLSETIFSSIHVLIAYMDAEFNFLRVNRAYARADGRPPEFYVGKNHFDLFPNEENEEIFRQVVRTGEPFVVYARPFEYAENPERGVTYWDWSLYPVADTNGRVTSLILSLIDVTARERAQQELLRARRLETAGRLAGQIAHDFNNLLGPLTTYPGILREMMKGDQSANEMLRDMEEVALRIAEINQQLLTLGRRGHYIVEPVNLNTLVNQVLREMNLPDRIRVQRHLDDRLSWLNGGRAQISRALSNLIRNAFEAMNDQGALTVTTRNVHLGQPLSRHEVVKPGAYVMLSVSDTGYGIPENLIDQIFEPFVTTKVANEVRGSGLGLAIVDSVISDHDGYIDVSSPPGKGTTISVCFPATDSRQGETPGTHGRPVGHGESVLVVDDDPLQLRIATRALGRLGYHVHTVDSGEAAVAAVTRQEQRYDVVLLDMMMDGIDGVETLRRIRTIRPDQRIILFSGHALNDAVRSAMAMGACEFLAKPVRLDALSQAMHRVLSMSSDPAAT